MLSPRLRLRAPFESQIWHSKLLLTSSKRSSMRPPRFLSPKIPKLSPNGASTLLIYLIFRSFDLKQSFSVYWSQKSESDLKSERDSRRGCYLQAGRGGAIGATEQLSVRQKMLVEIEKKIQLLAEEEKELEAREKRCLAAGCNTKARSCSARRCAFCERHFCQDCFSP